MNLLSQLLYTNQFDGTNYEWLDPILKVLDEIIWPILIVIASVGTIYAIYLGVLLAKAENADKREEAKKRVINVVIAIVVTVVLVLLMKLFVTYAPDIIKAEKPEQNGTGGGVIGAFIDYAKVMLIK